MGGDTLEVESAIDEEVLARIAPQPARALFQLHLPSQRAAEVAVANMARLL